MVKSISVGNLVFEGLTSDPTSTEGRMYYNTTDNKFKFYNGTLWEEL